MRPYAPILAMFIAFTASPVFADADDPPARVARLNYQSGSVAFRPGSVEEWTAATLNYPLTTGDHLWTDPGAQTEMHIGSTAIRMGAQTALAFLNLDDRTVQLSLTEGVLNVRIRYLMEDEVFELDTPDAAISLLRPGDYRIETDSDRGVTRLTVRLGEAEVNGAGGTFPVRQGEMARVSGGDSSREVAAAGPPDEFDQWCDARDRREERVQSARYVDREVTGYEDLDEYGVWRQEPEYGWVWAPRTVPVGWAPYHYGRWAWVEPWGWTWIDDEPWGFAPFHYGRWAYIAGVWVWLPGAMAGRPVYAPALVVFVGGGPRFGAAWFPLGPREVYRPGYHASNDYLRRVNIRHVAADRDFRSGERYVNRGVPGAVMAVNRETFLSGRPVHRGGIAVPERDLRDARIVGTAPAIAPRHESILAGPARDGAPRRFEDRAVMAKTAPAPQPVPFAIKRQALEGNQGRPLDPAALNGLRRSGGERSPMVRTVEPGRSGGWRQAAPSPAAVPDVRPRQIEGVRPVSPGREISPRSDRPVRVQEQPARPERQQVPFSRGDTTVDRSAQPARVPEQRQQVQPARVPEQRQQVQPARVPEQRQQVEPARVPEPQRSIQARPPEQRNEGASRPASPRERGQRRDERK